MLVAHSYGASVAEAYAAEHPERVLGALAEAAPEAFIGCFDGLVRHDPAAALRRYPGPILAVLQSRRESEPSGVHRLAPGLRYVTLAGVSHFLMMDDPTAFNRLLDDFLAKVDAKTP